ncbi:hypothetical protein [Luteolibacter soli]|uniref:Uncharacterized protein n=1 Tax=Luteolibacter soli TaxID=3135280 RepID=A0ABU9AVV4_9BACT
MINRPRILLLCCLLLALLGGPIAWKLAKANDSKNTPPPSPRNEAGPSPTSDTTANGDESKSSRRVVDYTAKAKSMLELRPGELGVLPVPADFLSDSPSDLPAPQGVPLVKGMVHKALAQQYLEGALRQGTAAQVKVAAGADGLDWKGEKLELSAHLGKPDEPFPDLLVDASAEGESTKISLTVPSGTCALVRSPQGESVLIVIGGGFPIGGVTREK